MLHGRAEFEKQEYRKYSSFELSRQFKNLKNQLDFARDENIINTF